MFLLNRITSQFWPVLADCTATKCDKYQIVSYLHLLSSKSICLQLSVFQLPLVWSTSIEALSPSSQQALPWECWAVYQSQIPHPCSQIPKLGWDFILWILQLSHCLWSWHANGCHQFVLPVIPASVVQQKVSPQLRAGQATSWVLCSVLDPSI